METKKYYYVVSYEYQGFKIFVVPKNEIHQFISYLKKRELQREADKYLLRFFEDYNVLLLPNLTTVPFETVTVYMEDFLAATHIRELQNTNAEGYPVQVFEPTPRNRAPIIAEPLL